MTLCPIEKCELKTADCYFSYSAGDVTIGDAYDISLTSTNIIAGQNIFICIQCMNPFQTIRKQFHIIQTSYSKCFWSLSLIKGAPIKIITNNSLLVTKGKNYFTNSEENVCPITECKLMAEDCKSVYLGK